MANDKSFLTYNQQMKKLRKDKKIDCNGTPHKNSSSEYMRSLELFLPLNQYYF